LEEGGVLEGGLIIGYAREHCMHVFFQSYTRRLLTLYNSLDYRRTEWDMGCFWLLGRWGDFMFIATALIDVDGPEN
jgi:hypothetical protein